MSCQSITQEKVELINANQLKELQSEGIIVVDIRTPGEYLDGHIPNVPNVDFRGVDFLEKMTKYDKTQPIIIHCASGGRSQNAASKLLENGFVKVYDYSGGFSDWKSKGEQIEQL